MNNSKITLVFFLFSIYFLTAQDFLPTKRELFDKWVVISNSPSNDNTIHLIRSERYNKVKKNGIEFFKGKYTGKTRIKHFKNYKEIKRCGNYSPFHPGSLVGADQAVWNYDTFNGILKVTHPRLLRSKSFKIKKESSSKLILTKI
ncbi:hypothetical protein [Aquimarina algicola]|uniref:Uncharacterized protein n=1 Tax=Aquimarina algicola TaxID=2589995 RepID=A0A504JQA6_9FLAO|nr:hypothetical protein [Aquimarina algicola]TPN89019.1 hypothetical protein FHK87_02025 [Aquimarina algicola]